MITISGGKLLRRKIKSPSDNLIRPTPNLVRKAVFEVASKYLNISVCPLFLDLFSGAGTMGIEAISRGVESAIFVEKSRSACKLIKNNLRLLNLEDRSKLMPFHVESAVSRLFKDGFQFYFIYMDPPYKEIKLRDKIISLISDNLILEKEGILLVEHHNNYPFPVNETISLKLLEQRKWGETIVSYYVRKDSSLSRFV